MSLALFSTGGLFSLFLFTCSLVISCLLNYSLFGSSVSILSSDPLTGMSSGLFSLHMSMDCLGPVAAVELLGCGVLSLSAY